MPTARLLIPLVLLAGATLCGRLCALEATGAKQTGDITAVDTAKMELSIAAHKKGGGRETVTLTVNAGTTITLDKKPAAIGDLKVNDQVTFIGMGTVATILAAARGGKGK